MPEEQKPFVHQDGSTTPQAEALAKMLAPHCLAAQIEEIEDQITYGRAVAAHYCADDDAISAQNEEAGVEQLGRVRAVLVALQQPSLNTTLAVMVGLDPTMQALASDVVLALGNAGVGHQKLAIALRKLIEGRS